MVRDIVVASSGFQSYPSIAPATIDPLLAYYGIVGIVDITIKRQLLGEYLGLPGA